jgi:sterol desaturase/sphingolipid hydroxylase (fatty acid hydroxylase superfamily)
MFDSRLDVVTRCRPVVPALIFAPAIVLLSAIALDRIPFWRFAIAFAGAYAFWTFTEYWIHRAIFHLEPRSRIGGRLHWMIHGVHHDHPSDPMRLVMPPIVTIPLGLLFLGAFLGIFGVAYGSAVAAGFFFGYLLYDMTHYTLHHRKPKGRLGRWLYELHMRHHFEDDERCFGVSAPWWDTVFGTAVRRGSRRTG